MASCLPCIAPLPFDSISVNGIDVCDFTMPFRLLGMLVISKYFAKAYNFAVLDFYWVEAVFSIGLLS